MTESNQISDQGKRKSLSDPRIIKCMLSLVLELQGDVKKTTYNSNTCVLDVGCGPDANTAIAYADKGLTVTAIDADSKIVDNAIKAAEKKNVVINFQIFSVNNKLPFDDKSFDIVSCRAALHHFPDKKAFFSEANRILKPGGKLNIMDPIVSEELKIVWTILSRLAESDHYSYATFPEMMKLFSNQGFFIEGISHFLFERKLDDWISKKIVEVDENGKEMTGQFAMYTRSKMKEIIIEFMDQKLRDELHFENRGDAVNEDWWFYYNCLEIAARKI